MSVRLSEEKERESIQVEQRLGESKALSQAITRFHIQVEQDVKVGIQGDKQQSSEK